jgi:ATP-dependent DNA ligase
MLRKELATEKHVQPRFIEPMYAEAVHVLPDGGDWTYEPKLDGYRCIASKHADLF